MRLTQLAKTYAGRVEIEDGDKARKVLVTPDDGSDVVEYPVSKRSRLLVQDGDRIEVGHGLVRCDDLLVRAVGVCGVSGAQAFVAAHHIIRVFLVMVSAGPIFGLIGRRAGKAAAE